VGNAKGKRGRGGRLGGHCMICQSRALAPPSFKKRKEAGCQVLLMGGGIIKTRIGPSFKNNIQEYLGK